MKVLIIPSWYPSKSYPNNGSFFKEQAEAFKREGIEVDILCIDIPYRKTRKDFSYFTKNSYVENGINVYRYVFPVEVLHRFPKLYYVFLKWIAKRIYEKELKGKKYDVIQAQSFLIGGYVGVCLKKTFGCKCVITEHTSKILKSDLNQVEKKVLKKCMEESDRFVCVSENLKSNVMKMTQTQKNIEVFPNLVNEIFSYEKKEREPFIFVSIGNLIPLKRMDLLIEAFCDTFSKTENVKLEIVGSGIEEKNLENIIKKNNRESQIVLCGALTRKEVSKVLKKSHVMALVSEKETFGIVYIEALASGNILIGSDNGGANDIITKENGIILKDSSKLELGKTLRMMYEQYSQYNSEQISKNAICKYGEKAFVRRYRQLFEEVE